MSIETPSGKIVIKIKHPSNTTKIINTESSSRRYPQLTFSEEKICLTLPPLEQLQRLYNDKECELKYLRETTPASINKNEEIFHRYHPEALILLQNPDQTTQSGLFTHTNRNTYYCLLCDWSLKEWTTVAEAKPILAHEKKIMKIMETINSLKTKIQYHRQLQIIQSITPIHLSRCGVDLVNCLIDSPLPDKTKHPRRIKSTKENGMKTTIFSLHLPLLNPQKEVIRYRLFRDHERNFSIDGSALIFVIGETTHSYGVIYPEQAIFYPRISLRAKSDQNHCDLLRNNVIGIFSALEQDPKEYFSKTGRQCGICQFCGRDLSDEISKKNGYGSVCGDIHLKNLKHL